ncbi:MAG: permease [Gammaproteobacteria bacterium]|nr:MAG: permease [Gammaproteobacteria bacterium]
MPDKKIKSGRGGWLFLALVLITYGLVALFDPVTTSQSLSFFTHVMLQVLPVLALVFLLLFIANLVLKPEWIRRYLGSDSGARGWLAATLGGMLSLGPIYPWYAMLAELRQQGMRNALIAAFLYSRAVKLPLLPLMIHYFGLAYTLILCFYLVVFSIISGIVIEKLTSEKAG